MMKNLKLGIIAAVVGTVGFITTSFAVDNNTQQTTQPEAMTAQKPQMMPFLHKCAEYKKLTADQKAKVDKIIADCKDKIMPVREQLMAKREELNKQFMTATPDENAINSLAKEISDLHNQMFMVHVQARMEMAKVGFSASECWKSKYPMMDEGMGFGKDMDMQHKMMQNSAPETKNQGM
jgi:Spy/CpxP family protein refolding chaperone